MIRPRRVLELHSGENISAASAAAAAATEHQLSGSARARQKSGSGNSSSRSPVTTPLKKARHLGSGSRPKTTTHWQWSPAKNRFCPQYVEFEDGQIAMNCERPQAVAAPNGQSAAMAPSQQQNQLFNPQDIQFRSKWQTVSVS